MNDIKDEDWNRLAQYLYEEINDREGVRLILDNMFNKPIIVEALKTAYDRLNLARSEEGDTPWDEAVRRFYATLPLQGATEQPEPGVQIGTAGQFAAYWNEMSVERREIVVKQIQQAMTASSKCWQADHDDIMSRIEFVNLVFTRIPGGPGQEAVFIETETLTGEGIRVGQWTHLMDTGYAALRVQVVRP